MDGRVGREWLETYQHRLQDLKVRADRAQAELAVVDGTASSPDGAVTCTVTPGGALRRLVLSERSTALSRTQLAAEVVATAARAQAVAAQAATEAVAPILGTDTEAMRVLRTHLSPEGSR